MFKHRKGYTLLEIILGFSLLMLVIVPFFSGVVSSVKALASARDRAKANTIAQAYMEKYKQSDITALAGFDSTTQSVEINDLVEDDYVTDILIQQYDDDSAYKKTTYTGTGYSYETTVTFDVDTMTLKHDLASRTLDYGTNVRVVLDEAASAIKFLNHATEDVLMSVDIASDPTVRLLCAGDYNEAGTDAPRFIISNENTTEIFNIYIQCDSETEGSPNYSVGTGKVKFTRLQKSDETLDDEGLVIPAAAEQNAYVINVTVYKQALGSEEKVKILEVSGSKTE